jgi:UDP-GlcNAc3NAcA epimerase
MKLTILTIVGARPQFIKAAPVSRALAKAGLDEILVHTGQHFDHDMSAVFFDELALAQPDYNLDINSLQHGAMTGRMLEKIEEIILARTPAMVLVYGDTNSTLAGALAAAKHHIPVAHIEAGLRSFNRRMPEEINRVLTDHISTLLFCPTASAVANLAQEGITTGVIAVGDVMYDATIEAAKRASSSDILDRLDLAPRSYSVATLHRAENTDDENRFFRIIDYLNEKARQMPMILVAHPRTGKLIERLGLTFVNIRLISPLGYLDMAQLAHNAAGIFTDSGGLQKEAYFHRVPCVTLRDETEWVETINSGWNRLWTDETPKPQYDISDYGTGNSSELVAAALLEYLGKTRSA